MLETGIQLVDIAIKAHMPTFRIDRETAQYWIHSAVGRGFPIWGVADVL
jgi:hypothetical protein